MEAPDKKLANVAQEIAKLQALSEVAEEERSRLADLLNKSRVNAARLRKTVGGQSACQDDPAGKLN